MHGLRTAGYRRFLPNGAITITQLRERHLLESSYRRFTLCPLFRMGQTGKYYREEVLEGAAGPSSFPKDLRGSLQALRTKTVDRVLPTPNLYTGFNK